MIRPGDIVKPISSDGAACYTGFSRTMSGENYTLDNYMGSLMEPALVVAKPGIWSYYSENPFVEAILVVTSRMEMRWLWENQMEPLR